MDTRYLEEYLVFAEDPNFSVAARKLFIARPTLVDHIRALEDELGCELVEHTGALPRLTAAGKRFVLEAQGALGSWKETCREFSTLADNLLTVNISPMNLALLEPLLYRARHNVQVRHPHKRIEVLTDCSLPVPARDASDRRVGNIVSVGYKKWLPREERPGAPEGYRGFLAGSYKLKLFVTWGSPLFDRDEIGPRDADGLAVILTEDIYRSWERDRVVDRLASLGMRLRVETRYFATHDEYFAFDFSGHAGVIPVPLMGRYGLDRSDRYRVFDIPSCSLETCYLACFREDVLQREIGRLLYDEMRALAPAI